MKEREIIRQFNRGELIPATDFQHGGADFSFDVVEPMWRQDRATKQFDLEGQVWIKRVKPLVELLPEQEHLCRPANLPLNRFRIIK